MSYLLFDFLMFSLEAFILEKYCRNTRPPVKHFTTSKNYAVNSIHKRDQTQEETFTATHKHEDRSWKLALIYT